MSKNRPQTNKVDQHSLVLFFFFKAAFDTLFPLTRLALHSRILNLLVAAEQFFFSFFLLLDQQGRAGEGEGKGDFLALSSG